MEKKQKIIDEEQEVSNTMNDEIAENVDDLQITTKFSENEGKKFKMFTYIKKKNW